MWPVRFAKFFFLLLVIACSQLVFFSSAKAKNRIALLIGNSRYDPATPLRNPQNDIELVQVSLQKAGFETFLGKDLNAQNLQNLIKRFLKTAKKMKQPTVLFYFAGHGVQLNGTNYLLPTDAPVDNPSRLKQVSLNASNLLKKLEDIDPIITLIILDACRDNPFENATRSIKRGLSNVNLEANSKLKSKVIAFSTAPGKVAADGEAGTSPYASAFAESLLIPGLTIEDVFRRTRRLVNQRTNGKQEPWENSSLYDKFVFIPKKKQSQISNSENEIWEFAAIVNTAESYRRYLEKYPNGLFKQIALTKIEAINKDFTYRRKAERFPILVAEYDDFGSCSSRQNYKKENEIVDHIIKYDEQIVFINISIPYRTLFCKVRGKMFYNANFYKNKDGECNFSSITSGEFDYRKIPCLNSKQALDEELIDGGMSFSIGQGFWVVHGGVSDYYRLDEDAAEGFYEEASFNIRGLVRLRAGSAEESVWVTIEPVNPKEIGLTGKYQNTLSEFNNGTNIIKLGSVK